MTHILRIDEMINNNNQSVDTLTDAIVNSDYAQNCIGLDDAECIAQEVIANVEKNKGGKFYNVAELVKQWLMEDWSHLFGTEEDYESFCQDIAMWVDENLL